MTWMNPRREPTQRYVLNSHKSIKAPYNSSGRCSSSTFTDEFSCFCNEPLLEVVNRPLHLEQTDAGRFELLLGGFMNHGGGNSIFMESDNIFGERAFHVMFSEVDNIRVGPHDEI